MSGQALGISKRVPEEGHRLDRKRVFLIGGKDQSLGQGTPLTAPPRGKTCLSHSQAATDRQARAFSVRSGA